MASAFTLTSSAYDGRSLRLYCTQSKDISTNKSKISWTLYSEGGNVNYYSVGPTTVTINGSQVYYLARKNWDAKVFPAAKGSTSGTIYIDHDSSGNKSITVSFSTAIYTSTVSTYSGTWTLDSIPRQATIVSAPDFNDTQLPTVTYNNPLGSSAEELVICIADNKANDAYVSYRAINKTGTLSYTFTAADIDALKNKTTNTLDISFVIRTKISGSYYYSVMYKKFTMTENSDTKPSVSITATLNNSSLPSALAGVYVQGKSKIDIQLSAQGKYGASISSYSSTLDGNTYSGASFTTAPIQKSGEVELVASAKDSRGFSGSVSKTFNIIPYSTPYITSFTVERQSDGTTVVATLKGGISPVENKNTKSFSVTLNDVTQAVEASSYTVDGTTTFLNVPTDSTLTATAKITDAFSTASKDATLPTVDVTMDFHSSGTGIKFGGVAENPNLFECDWPVKFNGGLSLGSDLSFESGEQTAERAVIFKNSSGTNPHNSALYGGNPNSTTAIGMWDRENDRCILLYQDAINRIIYGSDGTIHQFFPYTINTSGDTDGALAKEKLEELIGKIGNISIIPVRFCVYPYIDGNMYYGFFAKHAANYAILWGVSYNGYQCSWRKNSGTWQTPSKISL